MQLRRGEIRSTVMKRTRRRRETTLSNKSAKNDVKLMGSTSSILLKILQNILVHPSLERYRVLKLTNAKLRKTIFSVHGGVEFRTTSGKFKHIQRSSSCRSKPHVFSRCHGHGMVHCTHVCVECWCTKNSCCREHRKSTPNHLRQVLYFSSFPQVSPHTHTQNVVVCCLWLVRGVIGHRDSLMW